MSMQCADPNCHCHPREYKKTKETEANEILSRLNKYSAEHFTYWDLRFTLVDLPLKLSRNAITEKDLEQLRELEKQCKNGAEEDARRMQTIDFLMPMG